MKIVQFFKRLVSRIPNRFFVRGTVAATVSRLHLITISAQLTFYLLGSVPLVWALPWLLLVDDDPAR